MLTKWIQRLLRKRSTAPTGRWESWPLGIPANMTGSDRSNATRRAEETENLSSELLETCPPSGTKNSFLGLFQSLKFWVGA